MFIYQVMEIRSEQLSIVVNYYLLNLHLILPSKTMRIKEPFNVITPFPLTCLMVEIFHIFVTIFYYCNPRPQEPVSFFFFKQIIKLNLKRIFESITRHIVFPLQV